MKRLSLSLFMAVLLFLPVNALAEKLTFATMEWPPLVVVKEDKQLAGLAVEVVQEICNRLGFDADIKILPWSRAIKYMKSGRLNGLIVPKKTEDRLRYMYFSEEPMYIEQSVVIARKGSSIKASGLDDLKDKSFAVVREYSYGPKFDEYQGLKKFACDSDKQLIKIFYKGRTDLAVGEQGNLEWIRKDLGFKEPFEIVYVLSEDPDYVAFSKKSLGPEGEALARQFSQILRQLKQEGVYQEIESRY
ncbi:substrate-binding periplasmic protein [Desulfonema magnum]|uniref:ABC transporter, solute-binding protein family 3 n=1 Tax=Desulfonema magnum TaxID=45655 RepID=A0A975GRV5_9BACT|nr:transporter substrate-binding domain-containing protein [Desulfonema magnum]QTA91335.1 putative ABC transporter, solute-binding protein family 3 [Desulfonema magnum]